MKDALGDRMKGYEAAFDHRLPARLPVVVRLDGNSFSRLTRDLGLHKPFDERMLAAMVAATTAVLEYASGAVLGYTQSDEISVLLRNDRSVADEPFLGNRLQKLVSLCAAVCTDAFGRALRAEGLDPPPLAFDARAFVLPPAEVNNCFLWRQRDAFKNCVGAFAHHRLAERVGPKEAHRMLHGVSEKQRQELIFRELGVNVNDLPTRWKRGVCVRRAATHRPIREALGDAKYAALVASGHVQPDQTVERQAWVADREIPRFDLEPSYVEGLLSSP